jgi:CBS domain containing-hemolysin-like protein
MLLILLLLLLLGFFFLSFFSDTRYTCSAQHWGILSDVPGLREQAQQGMAERIENIFLELDSLMEELVCMCVHVFVFDA